MRARAPSDLTYRKITDRATCIRKNLQECISGCCQSDFWLRYIIAQLGGFNYFNVDQEEFP